MYTLIHIHNSIFSHFLDVSFVFQEQIGEPLLFLFFLLGGFYKLFRGMSIILLGGGAVAQKSGVVGWSPPKSSNIRMHSSFSSRCNSLKNHDTHSTNMTKFHVKVKSMVICLLLLHILVCSKVLWEVWVLSMCIISTSSLHSTVGGPPWEALTWTLWWTGGLIWHMGCSSRADSIYSSVHLKRSRCCWSTFRD